VNRIALYGGTFSPPHNGHVRVAYEFCMNYHPDILYVMPSNIPPHKSAEGLGSAAERLAMTRLAFETVRNECRKAFGAEIVVSDYEITRKDVSYTVYTLEYLKEQTDEKIMLLCGTDMFLTVDCWYRSERIFELADLICVRRLNDDLPPLLKKADEYRSIYKIKAEIIDVPPMELSSTEIREKIRAGEDVSEYIPESAADLIRSFGLYR